MSTSTFEEQIAAAVLAAMPGIIAAVTAQVAPAEAAVVEPQPKAEPKFRTEAQIAKGHEKERALYAAAYAAAGVKKFRDLDAEQQAAVKADVRAMWAGIKGTRKTKVA